MARLEANGYSVLELIFVTALMVTMSGIAVPQTLAALDEFRAAGAARYISARLYRARMEAVKRSTPVAIQFAQTSAGYSYTVFRDGNGNGVLTQRHPVRRRYARRRGGVAARQLQRASTSARFRGSRQSILAARRPVTTRSVSAPAASLTFTAHGSSSTGTVYIRGRRDAQYAVRVFGDTGKSRI